MGCAACPHLINQVKDFIKSGQKSITLDSITYKPESTILEESQQLKFAFELSENKIEVTIIEREKIINKIKELYGNRFKYIIK